jgi:glucose/arabinose dehydrogenase
MRRARSTLLVGASTLVLAACSSAGGAGAPTWVPSPALGAPGNGPGPQASPVIPQPSAPNGPNGSAAPGSSTAPGTGTPKIDPNVVATDLSFPVGLTMLPDGTALVGERTTGRIVRVQPRAGQPVPTVRTLRGLDSSGDGGLLDLALSPTFSEDGLVYAYITTRSDNRVVDFTLKGPVTPVLTGIPKGRTGNTGRITFGTDHDLYIGTGDAGRPSQATDAHSLAGKVLRVDDIGDPAKGNPVASSPVLTSGHRQVNGLCVVPRTPAVLEVEAGGPGRPDDVNQLVPGSSYGWPSSAGVARPAIGVLPAAYGAPGGCTVLSGRVWTTSLNGRALLAAPLRSVTSVLSVGKFTAFLINKYGRLKTVVAAADGALWLTTSNRDGHGKPVAADERVIRYLPSGTSSGSPV